MSTIQQGSSTNFSMEEILHAFLECSDALQDGVKAMLRIVYDPNTTEDEKAMAKHTIADILFPNYYNGQLGMDLAESERDAAADNEELEEIVAQMDREEATFSDALRTAMDNAKVSQTQLAEKIGVGQPAIANMLKRQCRPQMRTVVRLAEALGVRPDNLWPPAKACAEG